MQAVDTAGVKTQDDSPKRALARATWRICAASFLLHVHSEVDALLFMPFLYSRVQCCPPALPEGYSVTYPRTLAYGVNTTRLDACELPRLDATAEMWSHSQHCPSLPYVRDSAQALLAVYSPVRTSFALLLFPAAGSAADVLGRKPVLLVAGCGPIVAAALFWLDSFLQVRMRSAGAAAAFLIDRRHCLVCAAADRCVGVLLCSCPLPWPLGQPSHSRHAGGRRQ